MRGLQPKGVVGAGSEAGVQTRVQRGGSMAERAIEHVHTRNVISSSANVKWLTELGNTETF